MTFVTYLQNSANSFPRYLATALVVLVALFTSGLPLHQAQASWYATALIEDNSITAGFWSIVLNEIYPAPPPSEGVAPNDREWVELYNTGDTTEDITGWSIVVDSTTHTIEASCTGEANKMQPYDGADTTIASGELLALEFCNNTNNAKLPNTGATVTLLNLSSDTLDTHSYPDTNHGKSHSRIPNGGIWVDPVPTPGATNRVSMQDLIDSGLDQETIDKIVTMLAERGETLVESEKNTEVIAPDPNADTEAPVITVTGNDPAVLPLGAQFGGFLVTVSDNVNQNLGYVVEGEVNTDVLGEYTLAYSATDQAGNVGTATRTVIVYDPVVGPPEVEPIIEEDTEPAGVEEVIGGSSTDSPQDSEAPVSVVTEEEPTANEPAETVTEESENIPDETTEEEIVEEEQPTSEPIVEEPEIVVEEELSEEEGIVIEETAEEEHDFDMLREEEEVEITEEIKEPELAPEPEPEPVPELESLAPEEPVIEEEAPVVDEAAEA
jgi:hypothetical protein